MNVLRYCPDRPLPPYSYVPGLPAPHPIRDPRGHSFGRQEPQSPPLDGSSYRGNGTYLFAIDLFNHGFYWEAHEAWEALWHLAGRSGMAADFLKGLIKLAAAGVKAREGRAAGVRQHAERAAELLRGVIRDAGRDGQWCGLSLTNLVAEANEIASQAGQLAGHPAPDARRMLPIVLRLAGQPATTPH